MLSLLHPSFSLSNREYLCFSSRQLSRLMRLQPRARTLIRIYFLLLHVAIVAFIMGLLWTWFLQPRFLCCNHHCNYLTIPWSISNQEVFSHKYHIYILADSSKFKAWFHWPKNLINEQTTRWPWHKMPFLCRLNSEMIW